MTATFLDLVDLASERLGAAVVDANDEFFAPKENLIKPEAPIWMEGKYTERGKWMDGWETRRRRDAGDHDWCIVRLGVRGIVRGVDVDTAFFKGNYPESCAIDLGVVRPFDPSTLRHAQGRPEHRRGSDVEGRSAQDDPVAWREALARSPLNGDAHNLFPVDAAPAATHLRLRIYPDGGVARLRVYGDVVADWDSLRRRGEVDLAAVEHGGLVVACSDMFFGSRHNLIMPGDATHMGDGWETKRRRGPGHDWTIVRLGTTGTIRRIEVDTRHFKGNAPGACSLDASVDGEHWRELLARTPLQAHARNTFEDAMQPIGDITHVRFNIFPDGGVGRLRLFGRPRP
jgi:allantoicase